MGDGGGGGDVVPLLVRAKGLLRCIGVPGPSHAGGEEAANG